MSKWTSNCMHQFVLIFLVINIHMIAGNTLFFHLLLEKISILIHKMCNYSAFDLLRLIFILAANRTDFNGLCS